MSGDDGTGVRRVTGRRARGGTGTARRGLGRLGRTPRVISRGVDCVCPKCGAVTPHPRAGPCSRKGCPQCGAKMVRA